MKSLLRRLYHEQEGQVIYLVACTLIGLLTMGALSIDIGFALHAQRELQASADAAATAAALDLSNNLSASTAYATAYCASAVDNSGFTSAGYGSLVCANGKSYGQNVYNDLPGVTMVSDSTATYPVAACLSQLTAQGLTCDDTANANAIAVEEQVSIPTFFGKLFGVRSIMLKAQSLVAMKGGTPAPANIMMIIDSTSSMSNTDTACSGGTGISRPTREDCAKYGVRTLLSGLAPCAAGQVSCASSAAVDEVTLLTFPGLKTSSEASSEYNNCGNNFQSSYISPYAGPAGSQPPYFTIVQNSIDYKTSNTALNGGSSNLVKAVDWQDGNSCTSNQYGIQDPGGEGTYYAGVISEAQANLSAITGARAKMQGAIILLSDGDASSRWDSSGPPQSQFTSSTAQSYGQYECHQAVTAAQTAANTANSGGFKTWVYSIAYGSSTSSSSSCSTDSNPPGNAISKPISACSTMTQIASDPNKFYSDAAESCVSTAHPSMTNLGQIFTNISYDFLTTRMLPNKLYNNGVW